MPHYARLDDNFGSVMLEYTLRDLAERPYPYRSESDYWQEARRRFRYITRRNTQWKAGDRARSREELLDGQGWEIETNRRHRRGSAAERQQNADDPARRLLEEEAPTQAELLAALRTVGTAGKHVRMGNTLPPGMVTGHYEVLRANGGVESIPVGAVRWWGYKNGRWYAPGSEMPDATPVYPNFPREPWPPQFKRKPYRASRFPVAPAS